jgi:hypothetical protein
MQLPNRPPDEFMLRVFVCIYTVNAVLLAYVTWFM